MTTTNGLLLVDKPSGLTSHDVVAAVRKILHEKKVGHAGTLDPMATGLLVLAIGPSTRLLRFAQSEVKRYTGAVKFGVATDSLDADGAVNGDGPVPTLSSDEMNAVAQTFTGDQRQTPPMVSALKVGGKRLHELARAGVEVERASRDITVSHFALETTEDANVWNFDVECSVGTYVRVLLSDVANRLGTVGHLVALRRIASGSHDVKDALTLETLSALVEEGSAVVRPPADFVTALEQVALSDDEERKVRMGQRLNLSASFSGPEIAARSTSGALIGVLRRRDESWQPQVVLPPASDEARG